jgi:hypothetical protein
MGSMREWLPLALSGPVRRRALRLMAIVGAILITINHGDALLRGDVDGARFARMLLTLAVPYVVSTVSSVAAMREMRKKDGA